jgi:gephyrin
MITSSLQITPMASLSRPVAGVRNKSIIITLPGSSKGSTENLTAILPVLSHALELTRGEPGAGEATHEKMKQETSSFNSKATRSSHDGCSRHLHNHHKHHHHHHGHKHDHKSNEYGSGSSGAATGLSGDLNAPGIIAWCALYSL